jgi:starch-binding outer membrane protein, SusD/RagB family
MKKTAFLLLVLMFISVSCEHDYLTVVDRNRVTPDIYWKTKDECLASLASVYASLQIPWWGRWGTTEIAWTAQNYKADEIGIRDDRQAWVDINTFRNIPGNLTTDYTWFFCYQGVFFANQCLKYFPQSTMTDADKTQLMAEARFIRAFEYYLLVNYFRNVPLITQVPELSSDYYPGQASPQAVWAQIEDDLNYAKQNLPAKAPEPGRATRGAAAALLGKAHMQQLDWAAASTAFAEVINSGQYSLVANYASLFTGLNDNSTESVFEIQYSLTKPKGIDEDQPIPMNLYASGWNENWPADWLVAKYLKDTTATGQYSQRAWGSITFGDNDPKLAPGPFTKADITKKALWKKYCYVDAAWPADMYEVPTDLHVIRYADVLLSYAEAQNELGSTASAITEINKVRARAGVVPLKAGMSQAEVRTHLRETERPVELALENIRWLDLLRWDDMQAGTIKAIFTAHGRRVAANYTDTYKYYPIPQQDMDSNPNLVQNTGY